MISEGLHNPNSGNQRIFSSFSGKAWGLLVMLNCCNLLVPSVSHLTVVTGKFGFDFVLRRFSL